MTKLQGGFFEMLKRCREMRDEWAALDILRLDDMPTYDRLEIVLREELIDAPVLHEFACRCAERALSLVDNPDKRSLAAIETKRAWLRGECSDDDLAAASAAAWDAARDVARAAKSAAWAAACAATSAAVSAAARDAACAAARAERDATGAAACAATSAAVSAAAKDATNTAEWWAAVKAAATSAARDAAWADEREWQVAELIRMLEGA